MKEKYSVAASYRYRVDPETGEISPLAVWSPIALRDRIVDAEISVTVESQEGSSGGAASEDTTEDSTTGESCSGDSAKDAGHGTPGETS